MFDFAAFCPGINLISDTSVYGTFHHKFIFHNPDFFLSLSALNRLQCPCQETQHRQECLA